VEGLKEFLPLLPKELFCQILVVDGQSTDGSVDIAKSLGFEVYIQKQKGIRHAYAEAWPLIRGESVITFSPDANCRVQDLKTLVNEMAKGHDMVIASRYMPPAKSYDDDFLTRIGNWGFTFLISFLFSHKFTDSMTIYRIYRTNLFTDLKLDQDFGYWPEKLFRSKVGLEPLLSMRAAKKKLKIADIPSDEDARKHGVRKLQPFRWGAIILLQVFTEFIFWDTP
jgi:glycosyltransferase involved in cell wall biosynthesis